MYSQFILISSSDYVVRLGRNFSCSNIYAGDHCYLSLYTCTANFQAFMQKYMTSKMLEKSMGKHVVDEPLAQCSKLVFEFKTRISGIGSSLCTQLKLD